MSVAYLDNTLTRQWVNLDRLQQLAKEAGENAGITITVTEAQRWVNGVEASPVFLVKTGKSDVYVKNPAQASAFIRGLAVGALEAKNETD